MFDLLLSSDWSTYFVYLFMLLKFTVCSIQCKGIAPSITPVPMFLLTMSTIEVILLNPFTEDAFHKYQDVRMKFERI
jgi:hypothetical protein